MNLIEAERAKYTEVWNSIPQYKMHSPGLENVNRFFDVMHPRRGETLLDIGCGTGVAGLEFEKRGLQASWLDITDAGLSPEVPRQLFTQVTLWSDWRHRFKHGFDYGFCCDVMEHIPTELALLSVHQIMSACRTAWFQIALQEDELGKQIGQTLHLTVRSFTWWRDHLTMFGDLVEARDLCGVALYVVNR